MILDMYRDPDDDAKVDYFTFVTNLMHETPDFKVPGERSACLCVCLSAYLYLSLSLSLSLFVSRSLALSLSRSLTLSLSRSLSLSLALSLSLSLSLSLARALSLSLYIYVHVASSVFYCQLGFALDCIAASVSEKYDLGDLRSDLQQKILHNCSGT